MGHALVITPQKWVLQHSLAWYEYWEPTAHNGTILVVCNIAHLIISLETSLSFWLQIYGIDLRIFQKKVGREMGFQPQFEIVTPTNGGTGLRYFDLVNLQRTNTNGSELGSSVHPSIPGSAHPNFSFNIWG